MNRPPAPIDPEAPWVTALIAEDEPLLAEHLAAELAGVWPQLKLLPICGDGDSAVRAALAERPDVLFLDIRMPGRSGLEAAAAIAEDWPGDDATLPLLVFVTAYEQHAVDAFDRAAADYLLKPIEPARLALACRRLQALLRQRREAESAGPAPGIARIAPDTLEQLRALLATPAVGSPAAPLRTLPVAGRGDTVHLVPIHEVLYFEAADKYVRVVTAKGEHLIRLSLRQLQDQLDPQEFWQVHRGTLVRAEAVESAVRDEAGKVTLHLRGHPDRLAVSRLYAPRFKPW
jgi:DNA-binding LytR/AlgR family response regulator